MGKRNLNCDGWEGPCESKNAIKYRMLTNYVKDENNYRNLCPECQELSNDHWEFMWKEYYSMTGAMF